MKVRPVGVSFQAVDRGVVVGLREFAGGQHAALQLGIGMRAESLLEGGEQAVGQAFEG